MYTKEDAQNIAHIAGTITAAEMPLFHQNVSQLRGADAVVDNANLWSQNMEANVKLAKEIYDYSFKLCGITLAGRQL